MPPYHACTVRWNAGKSQDLTGYQAIVDAYQRKVGGFSRMTPVDQQQGDIQVHMSGESRMLPDKSFETFLVVEQKIVNPERRQAGETGVSLRFVHQFAPPE